MRELRLGTWLVTTVVLALGCDSSRPADPDTGVGVMDSGTPPTPDSGGGTDAGRDSGGGGPTCRPPLSECDLLRQDCGTGRACRWVSPSAGEDPRGLCEEPAGTSTEGMPCVRDTTMDSCAEGLICVDGTCRRYCCEGRTGDCPMIGTFCAGSPVGLCLSGSPCNPVDGSGCDTAGQACYPIAGENLCRTEGTAGLDEPCESVGCVAGHACLAAAGEPFTCKKLCNIADGAGCTEGQVCSGRIGDGSDPPRARTDIGFCEPAP